MDMLDEEISQFDYVFGGQKHRCGYRVVGDRLIAVVGQRESVAELDRMNPDRLARILVHELLVQDAFVQDPPKQDPAKSD